MNPKRAPQPDPSATSSQQDLLQYIQGGQIPFFRLPVVDPIAGLEADAVLMGVPYDGGTTYQPGARLGPYHVRRVSALVQPYHPVHRVDVFRRLRAVDGGNVVVPPFHAGAMRERVQAAVRQVAELGAAPVLVGGDHSITIPALRALARVHGPVALVHVDAHFDTSDGALWGEAYHHGTPVRHALLEGLVAEHQLYQIGLRGAWKDESEADLAAGYGAHHVSADRVEEAGIGSVMDEIRAGIGDCPVYLSFDIDAVDPAFAPGTGTPVPGGLSSREALLLVRGLAGLNVVGLDLVEVAPPMDHADVTSLLAAHLVYEGLALLACRDRAQP